MIKPGKDKKDKKKKKKDKESKKKKSSKSSPLDEASTDSIDGATSSRQHSAASNHQDGTTTGDDGIPVIADAHYDGTVATSDSEED